MSPPLGKGNGPGQAQSKAGPADRPALIASEKPVENLGEIILVDPHATVPDRQVDSAVVFIFAKQANLDVSRGRGLVDGVVQ